MGNAAQPIVVHDWGVHMPFMADMPLPLGYPISRWHTLLVEHVGYSDEWGEVVLEFHQVRDHHWEYRRRWRRVNREFEVCDEHRRKWILCRVWIESEHTGFMLDIEHRGSVTKTHKNK
jgi:hypothetical protein